MIERTIKQDVIENGRRLSHGQHLTVSTEVRSRGSNDGLSGNKVVGHIGLEPITLRLRVGCEDSGEQGEPKQEALYLAV